ncbi:MAG: hypothetical protein AUK63_1968 [bacterium P3]|nr:MAG: hypothetical protein AUK63_1968 [bacterium P3]KWW34434.1 MAG: hypothetical protein F083_2465 [bacterium F083]
MNETCNNNGNHLMRISHEMAGGLQQLSGLADDCFEYIMATTEAYFDELLAKKRKKLIKLSRMEIMYIMQHREYSFKDFHHLEPKNDDRIRKALEEIQHHSAYKDEITSGRFVSICVVSKVDCDMNKKRIKINLDDTIFYHYLNKKTTFEYDRRVTDLFKKKFSKNLYILGCSRMILAEETFSLSESYLRKLFSYDLIDIKRLEYFDIYDEDDLPVKEKKKSEWRDIYSSLVSSLNEIEESFQSGVSPFWLAYRVSEEKVREGKRGNQVIRHTMEFTIQREHFDDAVATEIKEVPTQLSASASKKEPIHSSTIYTELGAELQDKIEDVKMQYDIILSAAGEPKTYVEGYKARLGKALYQGTAFRSDLPECMLAWIEFTKEWKIKNKKDETDLSRKFRSNIKLGCHYDSTKARFELDKSLVWPPGYRKEWLSSFEKEKAILKSKRRFIEGLKLELKIDDNKMNDFECRFWEGIEFLHSNEDDLFNHFRAWVILQKDLENKQININEEKNNYGTTKRTNESKSNEGSHDAAIGAINRKRARRQAMGQSDIFNLFGGIQPGQTD